MAKTGEICQTSGWYKFAGHTDGNIGCHPTIDEQDIPMKSGNRFPPIRSCERGAYWNFVRPL